MQWQKHMGKSEAGPKEGGGTTYWLCRVLNSVPRGNGPTYRLAFRSHILGA